MALATKAFLWQLAIFLISALVVFLPAGTFAWAAGWIFLGIFFGFVFLLSLWLLYRCPELLAERLTFLKPNQTRWDKVFHLLFYTLSPAWLALRPLDTVRWQWSHLPL